MHMQASQCGNHMDNKFWELVCDEHGIGGDGEYFVDNDMQLGRINVLYRKASGGKFVPRAGLFYPRTWRDRLCARVAARRALSPGQTREPKRGRRQKLSHYTRVWHELC
jgi:hypothetical protein